PAESARNGEIPKFQKPLFGTTPPSALSGLVVQTFPSKPLGGVHAAKGPATVGGQGPVVSVGAYAKGKRSMSGFQRIARTYRPPAPAECPATTFIDASIKRLHQQTKSTRAAPLSWPSINCLERRGRRTLDQSRRCRRP
ncbi:hypothetical protein, partial [Xanthomonas phaseoli]